MTIVILVVGLSGCNTHVEVENESATANHINYPLGLVYIYCSPETYNSNWRTEFETIIPKVENALKEVTDNKINASIEILGEVETDIFCWNPATVGGKFRNIEIGSEFYFRMPCSAFSSTGIDLDGYEIVESYCDNCITITDATTGNTIYTMNCENILSWDNLWNSSKLDELDDQISQELEFNFTDYEGVFIIFGKLGQILPYENEKNLEYLCTGLHGHIAGYSNLIMSENSMKAGGLINCTLCDRVSFYEKIGWHTMVHEILHKFGGVDVYHTGTTFGITTHFDEAIKVDPKTNESIMGDEWRDCMERGHYEKDGIFCTIDELERVYLDEYNRQKIHFE